MIVYRLFDDGSKSLTDSLDYDTMKTFVEMYRFPVVREFDQKSAEDIFGKEKSAVFIFNDLNKSD